MATSQYRVDKVGGAVKGKLAIGPNSAGGADIGSSSLRYADSA